MYSKCSFRLDFDSMVVKDCIFYFFHYFTGKFWLTTCGGIQLPCHNGHLPYQKGGIPLVKFLTDFFCYHHQGDDLLFLLISML